MYEFGEKKMSHYVRVTPPVESLVVDLNGVIVL